MQRKDVSPVQERPHGGTHEEKKDLLVCRVRFMLDNNGIAFRHIIPGNTIHTEQKRPGPASYRTPLIFESGT